MPWHLQSGHIKLALAECGLLTAAQVITKLPLFRVQIAASLSAPHSSSRPLQSTSKSFNVLNLVHFICTKTEVQKPQKYDAQPPAKPQLLVLNISFLPNCANLRQLSPGCNNIY